MCVERGRCGSWLGEAWGWQFWGSIGEPLPCFTPFGFQRLVLNSHAFLFQDLVEVFLEYWLWSSGSEVKGFDLGVFDVEGRFEKIHKLIHAWFVFFMALDACEGSTMGSMTR